MMTDPRDACANEREKWFWAAVHDLLAHPFMVLTWYSYAALMFHDWTSRKAWPRPAATVLESNKQSEPLVMTCFRGEALKPVDVLVFETAMAGFYCIEYTHRSHSLVVQAENSYEAFRAGRFWLAELEGF